MIKQIWSEFRKFAIKGNAIDLAVGVVIGGAFGKITSSLVADVINPPLGLLLGKVDFSRMAFPLNTPADGSAPVAIRYGAFINSILDFMLVAMAIFLMVRTINTLKEKKPPAAPNTKECSQCCSVIPIKAVRCPQCTSQLS